VRDQLVSEFRELRHVSVDNLIYVKEDIILPHHYTFYDLIASKVWRLLVPVEPTLEVCRLAKCSQ